MAFPSFPQMLVGLLALLAVLAAITDLRHREIALGHNLLIALCAVPFWFAIGLEPWPAMALRIGVGLLLFAIFAVPFALGQMGGGDVKFIAAASLWFPPARVLDFILVTSLAGVVVTLGTIIWERRANGNRQPEIPYGVAISFAVLWGIGQRYVNPFT